MRTRVEEEKTKIMPRFESKVPDDDDRMICKPRIGDAVRWRGCLSRLLGACHRPHPSPALAALFGTSAGPRMLRRLLFDCCTQLRLCHPWSRKAAGQGRRRRHRRALRRVQLNISEEKRNRRAPSTQSLLESRTVGLHGMGRKHKNSNTILYYVKGNFEYALQRPAPSFSDHAKC